MMANREERNALQGLPDLAHKLYFYICMRMDYKTGMVGDNPNYTVSWNAFSEDMEVPSTQGRKRIRPTIRQVRHAASILEDAGLIENRTVEGVRQLILFCRLATIDNPVFDAVDPVSHFSASNNSGRRVAAKPESEDGICTVGKPVMAQVSEECEPEQGQTEKKGCSEVGQTSCYPDTYECVSDTTTRERFFAYFMVLVRQEVFSERELLAHIEDYLQYNAERGSKPSRNGLANLLWHRTRFRRQASEKIRAVDELRQAEVEKFNALAEREQMRADHIASETIYRQQNPMRH